MRTRKARTVLLSAVVTGAVAVGAVIPALADTGADADTGATETTEDDAVAPFGRGFGMRGEGFGPNHEAFAAALAEELGIPESEVAAAIETVTEELRGELRTERLEHLRSRLEAAVEAGELSQERADEILEAHESGTMPAGRGGGHGMRGGFGAQGRAMLGG